MNKKQLLLHILFCLLTMPAVATINVRARHLSIGNGLSSGHVRSIVQDTRGYIWLGTTDGLVRYDGYGTLVLTPDDTPERKLMKDSRILAMKWWEDRYLLIRFRGQAYSCYDTENNRFIDYPIDYDHIFQAPQEDIDNRGNAFSLTPQGDVILKDKKTGNTIRIADIFGQQLQQLGGKPRFYVVTDRDGIIWISTYGNGLLAHDPQTGETVHWKKSGNNEVPIQTNYLINLYEDRMGNIWVCQENMGVVCLSKDHTQARRLFFSSSDDMGHTNSFHLLKNVNGTIYIGNRNNELRIADGHLQHMRKGSEIHDDVVAVCADHEGTVWEGTRQSGIYIGQTNYRHRDGDDTSLAKGKISDILCDRQGRMWISIFDAGIDLAESDGKGGYRFRHFFTGKHAINQPRQMVLDPKGAIWLCSSDGIYTFQPDRLIAHEEKYEHLLHHPAKPNGIHSIYASKGHHIVCGTIGRGLLVVDNSGDKPVLLRNYTTSDGLPSNNIYQLMTDQMENLWIGTDLGLARYDHKTQSTVTLTPATEPLGNMCVENAVCRLDDGQMAFGTHHGIVIVDPKNVKGRQPVFPLRITDMTVNGVEGNMTSGPLELNYQQNSLSFRFSDFEFAEGQQSRFSYRLKGYDKEWSPMTASNIASYKNLPPGDYTLEVRTQDWQVHPEKAETSMAFTIRPPFWATWWAYLIYIVLTAAIITALFRHYKRVYDLRNRIKVEEELTAYKIQFFTNISHEFRTPLTIIRGAMDHITGAKEIPADMRQPVSAMQRSVNRLMRMINQLMEFSKLHEGKLKLAVEETDVVAFVRDIYLTFREMAEQKNISYQFTTTHQSYTMLADQGKLDKIVYNLISNAFKYTPAHHSITVKVVINEQEFLLSVEDTGIGISKEKQKELFTRFNQSSFAKDSIGIGLHLTQELTRVHHGSIRYAEHPEGGSIFTISLPTDQTVYSPEELMSKDNKLVKEEAVVPVGTTYKEMAPDPMNDLQVLIVEDDHDVREHLRNELQRYFVIRCASDGAEALGSIREQRPDLIISDVMMPIMNGYELTRKLRSDATTTDIPIILLTALGSEDKMVKGLDCGADAFITKPFSTAVLMARCTQLLQQRRQLKVNYAKEVVNKSETPAIIVEEQEKRLRAQLDTWLHAHLRDPNLNIDTFAQKMGYGRTTFYKKMKKLTGKTPNDYIRTLRMEKAVELLKDDTVTIAQVSYEVGIDDPYYFSKTFKAFYGISPSQYRKGEKPTK